MTVPRATAERAQRTARRFRAVTRPLLLLVHWAGKGATKMLRFAPRCTNLAAKTGEPGRQVHEEECDHDRRLVLTSKPLICRSASSDSFCSPWVAIYCSTTRSARRWLASTLARNNRTKNEGFLVGAESQAPVVRTFAIRWLLFGVVLGANFLPEPQIGTGERQCEAK